jgi:NAD(P)-dependent dehydrogenase (short-subunit alcohol dehydrogenase family)
MKKTLLITGSSSGFGKATARLFAARGWNVIATMRRPEDERDLNGLSDVLVTRLDVQDCGSIAAAIGEGIARFGRIDALVNNAGFGLFGLFEATPPEKIAEQFGVNVFGVMNVTRAILPHFRQNRGGLILNIGSGAGVYALPMLSLYCASKFALEGFTESVAYELASQNVMVKMIEPGGVLGTNFGRRSGAESANNAVLPDYDAFVAHASAVFDSLGAERLATEDDVAQVVYEAAADGTSRLRYVATEDIKPLVKSRRETSEDEYMAFMRARFGLKP